MFGVLEETFGIDEEELRRWISREVGHLVVKERCFEGDFKVFKECHL